MIRATGLALLLAVAAIGDCGPSGTACEQVFAANVNEIGGGKAFEGLDAGIGACGSLDEWTAAWAKFPKAHGSETEPIVFLAGRCLETAQEDRPLCQAARAALQ